MLSLVGRSRDAPDRRPRKSRAYGESRSDVNRRTLLASALALAIARPGHAAAPGARPRILALGDSLTAGFGLAADEAFPARLQAKLAGLGVAAEVINAGVSGDTTAGGLARLDWALADHPGYAIVELGANDMLRGLDPQQAKANLDRILTRLAAAQVKALLAGMQALGNWGRDYAAEFAAIYPALAEKHHVPLYPFFLDGMALDLALTLQDGLHPNAKGVEIIVDRITPYVLRLLGAKPEGE
jgi:acyl-CoA thioesterase-1